MEENKLKGNDQKEKRKTILIADDEADIRELISDFFELEGYSTIIAKDGYEAFALFEENRPDLVITDIRMPRINGFELVNKIKNKNSSVPIILISVVRDYESLRKAYQMGIDEYIGKPFKLTELLEVVKKVLNKSKQLQDIQRFKDLSDFILKENKILKEKLEQLSESKAGAMPIKEAEKYKAVCREVAHDLKGEFMHIGYSLKEIRESTDPSGEVTEECDMIERSLAYSRLLLERLLNFLDMGSLQMEPIELAELIRKTEALAKPRLPSNIQLHIRISPHTTKTRISANFDQLMAVLMEFINNASKVLRPKGGIIEIKLEEKNNHALVSIKDDGPGIPVELKDKILNEQVPSKNGGLGLGLYLCNKVIDQVGGKLNMETKKGKGTTFTMILPTIREKKES
jgi:two-component system sensor histidine kinase/response regulator